MQLNLNILIVMKTYLFILSLLLTSLSLQAQRIEATKVFGGYRFTQNNKNLSKSAVVNAVKNNEKAYKTAKSGYTKYFISQVLGAAGGFMIGWEVGTSIAGGNSDWKIAGIGAGLIVISIPISLKANKQLKSAADMYNASLPETAGKKASHLKLNIVGNQQGVGLALSF